MASNPSKARLLELSKLSKSIFHETFNPTQARSGAKVLRAGLKGDVVKNYYYPSDFLKFKELRKLFPDLHLHNEKEQYRLDSVNEHRRRGKGAPKKSKAKKAK